MCISADASFSKYYLVFVLSTKLYCMPFPSVGGNGSPFTTVLSVPVLPPLGPIISYWPENGASCPGFKFLLIILVKIKFAEDRLPPRCYLM